MRHGPGILTTLVLALLVASGAAAQSTQVIRFHWAPSPEVNEQGEPLPSAIGYEVWLRRDADAPVRIETVSDTLYSLQADAGVVHRIRVVAFDDQGRFSLPSEWSDPVYFEDELRGSDSLPGAAALRGNYPNPFNPETRIRYGVPENIEGGTPMRLEVFALDGRRIRSFEIDSAPGWHEVTWDGTDDRGVVQATGTYVTRFIVGSDVATAKMTMVK